MIAHDHLFVPDRRPDARQRQEITRVPGAPFIGVPNFAEGQPNGDLYREAWRVLRQLPDSTPEPAATKDTG